MSQHDEQQDQEDKEHLQKTPAGGAKPVLFTKDGKPLRVLSTSLGIALVANALLGSSFAGEVSAESEGTAQTAAVDDSGEAQLVEWSNEAVKAYFDPSADWNIPALEECDPAADAAANAVNGCADDSAGSGGAGGSGGSTSGSTTVVRTYSSFGWDDVLLYHMMFNNGSSYSSSTYHTSHRSYDVRTGAAYKTPTYNSDAFQNRAVAGSAVRPKTTNTTGSITKRSSTSSSSSSSSSSKSSSAGGIGGKSSSFSSSGSSKSSGGLFGG